MKIQKKKEENKHLISGENHSWFGRKHSEESKRKISQANTGRERPKEAIESQREKLKECKRRRKNELKKLERQLTLGVPFDSIIIASDGDKLTEILSHLAFYDINANNTFIYGTSFFKIKPSN